MKRERSAHVVGRPPKRARPAADQSAVATPPGVDHPVLRRLYPGVLSLRHYLLSRLPASSKYRRRRLTQLGLHHHAQHHLDADLAQLLDATLIGIPRTADAAGQDEAAKDRARDIDTFSQQLSSAGTFKPGYFLQSEVTFPPAMH